jgi:hypothetical protein
LYKYFIGGADKGPSSDFAFSISCPSAQLQAASDGRPVTHQIAQVFPALPHCQSGGRTFLFSCFQKFKIKVKKVNKLQEAGGRNEQSAATIRAGIKIFFAAFTLIARSGTKWPESGPLSFVIGRDSRHPPALGQTVRYKEDRPVHLRPDRFIIGCNNTQKVSSG